MPKVNSLESSVERKVKGDQKKEVSWPKSIQVTRDHLNDPAFVKKYPNATLGSEICDPVPLYLNKGEKRGNDAIIDEIRLELRKEKIKQDVVMEHFAFDQMSDEQKRAFFEEESDFELPDDHSSILTAYEQAGIIVDAVPEYPTNPDTPLNTTENPPVQPSNPTATPPEAGVSGETTPTTTSGTEATQPSQ